MADLKTYIENLYIKLEALFSGHPFIYLLFLIVLSFIFAKIIDIIFVSVFHRIVKKTNNEIDDKIIEIIHKPIYYSILFVGLSFSVSLIGLSETIQFIVQVVVITFNSLFIDAFCFAVDA